ncbi:hypothetical protein ES703_26738 [subsurface metagenome]
MPICKYCGEEVDYLSSQSLCKYCVENIKDKLNAIRSFNKKIADKSEMIGTRILNCDLLIEYAEELFEFEKKGIEVSDPKQSFIIEKFQEVKKHLKLDKVKEEVEKYLEKAKLATTIKTKINSANKALLKISDAKKKLDYGIKTLKQMEIEVKYFIHKIKLDDFIEKAQKFEFKGNKKKALDQYQEALYFLKTDEINDSFQKGEIEEIEKKINELSK